MILESWHDRSRSSDRCRKHHRGVVLATSLIVECRREGYHHQGARWPRGSDINKLAALRKLGSEEATSSDARRHQNLGSMHQTESGARVGAKTEIKRIGPESR